MSYKTLVKTNFWRYLIIIPLLLLLVGHLNAQFGVNDRQTPLGLAPGTPAGSYSLTGLEDINVYNGHLNIKIPLLQIAGRGGARYTMTKVISKPSWVVEPIRTPVNESQWSWVSYPNPNWWNIVDAGYGPGILHGRRLGASPMDYGSGVFYSETFTQLIFTSPDGTEHVLYDQVVGGGGLRIHDNTFNWHFERGNIFASKDGAGITFVSDTPIYDYNAVDLYSSGVDYFLPTGNLMMPDGTLYRIGTEPPETISKHGLVTRIRDRNGNELKFTYDGTSRVTEVFDSLKRKVTIQYDIQDMQPYGFCDRIMFQGSYGAPLGPERIIRVSKAPLLSTLRSDYPSGQTMYQLFPQLGGSSPDYMYQVPIVSSIWLPDATPQTLNRRYRFYYNPHGNIARLDLPTGGNIHYNYAAGLAPPYTPNGTGSFESGQIGKEVWPSETWPSVPESDHDK